MRAVAATHLSAILSTLLLPSSSTLLLYVPSLPRMMRAIAATYLPAVVVSNIAAVAVDAVSRVAAMTSAAIHSVVAVDTAVVRAIAAMIAGADAADIRVMGGMHYYRRRRRRYICPVSPSRLPPPCT